MISGTSSTWYVPAIWCLRQHSGASNPRPTRSRPEKVEKRPVRLGVRAEKVEFSEHGVRLRITGVISRRWTPVHTTRSMSRPVMKYLSSASGGRLISNGFPGQ